MSNPYLAIAEYLQDSGVVTVGQNIFVAHVPPSPDTCLTIYPTPANIYYPPDVREAWSKGSFQLYGRSHSFDEAYNLIISAFNWLQGASGDIGGFFFLEIVALNTEVHSLGKDELNRMQLVQNYRFEIERFTINRV